MTEENKPLLEFPCEDYLIKVIGTMNDDFTPTVLDLIQRYAPDLDKSKVEEHMSSKGTFCSLNVRFTATGQEQIENMIADLMASGRVNMVL